MMMKKTKKANRRRDEIRSRIDFNGKVKKTTQHDETDSGALARSHIISLTISRLRERTSALKNTADTQRF